MENFEKWWYESDFDEELLDPYYFAKNVWEKALRWALEQRVSGWESDGSISYSDCIHATDIEKELGPEEVK